MPLGRSPTGSIVTDFIPKVAIALHLLHSAFNQLNSSSSPEEVRFEEEITLETLDRAVIYSQHVVEQKSICTTVSKLKGD